LVPGVLALLPEYAGLEDPVAELRAAALSAAAWLAGTGPVTLVADAQGARIGHHLLAEAGGEVRRGGGEAASYLVVANGSARRSEQAPGFVDERAVAFDAALDEALRQPDVEALARLEEPLADELLVGNSAGLARLGTLLRGASAAMVDYADDPFGVQYWVMRWTVPAASRTGAEEGDRP